MSSRPRSSSTRPVTLLPFALAAFTATLLATTLGTMKGVLISFDSTMRSNLSVGMPIDLICIERDSLRQPGHGQPERRNPDAENRHGAPIVSNICSIVNLAVRCVLGSRRRRRISRR